jgi:CheY-like chemotaxis protein
MGQSLKPTALVVEDDRDQRALVGALLEECELKVVECETAEAAAIAMEHLRDTLVMIFVDVNLAGNMNGVELATLARQCLPHVAVVLTSGGHVPKIPADTVFMQKPWRALDLLRVAESARAGALVLGSRGHGQARRTIGHPLHAERIREA